MRYSGEKFGFFINNKPIISLEENWNADDVYSFGGYTNKFIKNDENVVGLVNESIKELSKDITFDNAITNRVFLKVDNWLDDLISRFYKNKDIHKKHYYSFSLSLKDDNFVIKIGDNIIDSFHVFIERNCTNYNYTVIDNLGKSHNFSFTTFDNNPNNVDIQYDNKLFIYKRKDVPIDIIYFSSIHNDMHTNDVYFLQKD